MEDDAVIIDGIAPAVGKRMLTEFVDGDDLNRFWRVSGHLSGSGVSQTLARKARSNRSTPIATGIPDRAPHKDRGKSDE
jgi:hypothetical protein